VIQSDNSEEVNRTLYHETEIGLLVVEYPFTENFDASTNLGSGWVVDNANDDEKTWQVVEGYRANSLPNYIKVSYNADMPTDDWLISPAFEMNAGESYEISFAFRANMEQYTEKLSLYSNIVPEDFTNLLYQNLEINNTDYEEVSVVFSPQESGMHFFAWHGHSDTDQAALLLDDISISQFQENISYEMSAIQCEDLVNMGEEFVLSAEVTNTGNVTAENLEIECVLNNEICHTITLDELDVAETEELSHTYTAASPNGINSFSFRISDADEILAESSVDFEVIDTELPAAADPEFSHLSGIYESFDLEITTTSENAEIYYTLDGTEPDNSSLQYSEAITISETTTVKAIAIESGVPRSSVVSHDYVVENLYSLPYATHFPEDMDFAGDWQAYEGVLSDDTDLTSDWAAWIIQNSG
jgi:hypothetical protein